MLSQAHALCSQRIDVWCLNIGIPETAKIPIAEIIGQDEYNVWPKHAMYAPLFVQAPYSFVLRRPAGWGAR